MLSRLLIALTNLWILLRNARRRLRRRTDYVYLEISGTLPEFAETIPLLRRLLGTTPASSLEELRQRFRRIANDRRTRGVILVLHDFAPGWSTSESLRSEMHALRARNKRVIAYLPGADTRTYFAACAADTILMPPSAYLNLLGISTEVLFFGDALRMLGIDAEVTAVSPYKSAGDAFVRSDLSPESREQLDRLLDQRYEHLLTAIASDRHLNTEQARTLIDTAPHTAVAAHEHTLIDGLCYADELATWLGAQHQTRKKRRKPRPAHILRWKEARHALRIPYHRRRTRTIAVVSVEGAIVNGQSRSVPGPIPLLGGQQAGSESLARVLRQVERNDQIAALVLHIDSPGGDSFASDLIWREVLRVRQKKPVVASMGNVAASGGYYIATCANKIIAHPGTITGSIGVLALYPVAERLLDRAGINVTLLQRGARAGWLDITRAPGDDSRTTLRQIIFETYDQFKQRVRDGRGLSEEHLEPLAGGRVWTGQEARQHGLVDELGGLPVALARARDLAGLPPDPAAPFERITAGMRGDTPLPLPFPTAQFAELTKWIDTLETLRRPRILTVLPWIIRERG